MYLIHANLNYSSSANRTTAQTNITNALASYNTQNVATALAAGINGSGVNLTVSVLVPDNQIEAVRNSILGAWSSATRATTGYYVSEVKR